MKRTKGRLTVTVDRDLIRAGNRAVTAGRPSSLSSWVNQALAERTAKERRVIDAALALLTDDEDRILTSDVGDIEPFAAAAGRHVEILRV